MTMLCKARSLRSARPACQLDRLGCNRVRLRKLSAASKIPVGVVKICGLVFGLIVASGLAPAGLAQAPSLPSRLDAYVTTYVRLTAGQRQLLLSGGPVTALLETSASEEVAVFGATWVDALPGAYVEQVKDIERFERGGGFRVTKRISDPPRLEDFASLRLPRDDVADLKNCRLAACEIKLSQSSLERLRREIDWSKPSAAADVEALTRELALEYVTGYLEGGNARLAVYRDARRPTFVANEFRSMIERLPALVEYLPELRAYLLDYPKAKLPSSSSFLYWQEAQFGLKPTIRINHVVIVERPGEVVAASKLLYASHYFWTALELRVLLSDPARGRGFWFITINRSRSDGLTGFTGRLVRRRVESEAQKGVVALLQNTKSRLERQP